MGCSLAPTSCTAVVLDETGCRAADCDGADDGCVDGREEYVGGDAMSTQRVIVRWGAGRGTGSDCVGGDGGDWGVCPFGGGDWPGRAARSVGAASACVGGRRGVVASAVVEEDGKVTRR